MNQSTLLDDINRFAERERELRHAESTRALTDAEKDELDAVQVHLDQAWDLLRQWRAHREFGLDTNNIAERPEGMVEGYQQ